MLRKAVATLVAVLLLFPLGIFAAERPDTPPDTTRLEKLKADVESLRLSGKKAVVVTTDDRKLSGHIVDVTNSGFTLITKTGERSKFLFLDVRSVKKSGLSTGAKVGIGVGIGVAAWVGIACAIACNQ
jgi:hypothetical protein